MSGTTMIVLIVAVCVVGGVFTEFAKALSRGRSRSREDRRHLEDLDARLLKIEERLANLETITLDLDKRNKFDRELHRSAAGRG